MNNKELPKDLTLAIETQYADAANLRSRMSLFKDQGTLWTNLFSKYEFTAGDKILEIGAGDGQFWVENENSILESLDITLSDVSGGMIEAAKGRLSLPSCTFDVADIQALPYEDKSFDWVIGHFMFYHVPRPERGFDEAHRVLKEKGAFALLLYRESSGDIDELDDIIRAVLGEEYEEFERSSTLQFFSDEARKLGNGRFHRIVEDVFPSKHDILDPNVALDAALSLPFFQVAENRLKFEKPLKKQIKEHMEQHGVIHKSSTLSHLIFCEPLY